MNRILKWAGLTLAGVLIVVGALVAYLIATPAGTRTLVRFAAPYLPAELAMGQIGGTVLSGLSVNELRWDDGTVDIVLDEATIDIQLRALAQREIYLSSLHARGIAVDIGAGSSDGDAQTEQTGLPIVIDLPFGIVIEDLTVERLHVVAGDVDRRVNILSAALSLRGSQLIIDRFSVDADWLTASLNGRARLAPPYDGDIVVDYSFRGADNQMLAGDGRLHGDRAAYSLEHDLTSPYAILTRGQLSWQEELRVDLVNSWTDLFIALGDDRQLISRAGRLKIDGGLDGVSYLMDADATLPTLGDVSLNADGTADTTELRLTGATMATPERRLEVAGTAVFDFATATLRFQSTRIASGNNTLLVDGIVGDAIDLRVRADARQLGAFYPGLAGELDADLTVSGTLPAPQLAGTLAGRQLAFADWFIESVNVRADQATGRESSARIDAADIRRGDTNLDRLSVLINGDFAQHDVAINIRRADTSANIRAEGQVDADVWLGKIQSVSIDAHELGRWNSAGPATFVISAPAQRVDELCMTAQNTRRVCAQLDRDAASDALNLSATVESLPLDGVIQTALPQVDANGTLSGNLSLSLQDGSYSGRFSAAADDLVLRLAETADEDEESVALSFGAEGQIQNNRLTARGQIDIGNSGAGRLSLLLMDVRDANGPIQASVDFGLRDLSAISLFTPGARVEGGAINGELTLTGSASAPVFGGSLRVSDAAVNIPASGVRFTELTIEIEPGAAETLDFNGSAVAGGGRIGLNGSTRIDAAAGWPTVLTLDGEDAEIVRTPDWSVVVSPDLKVNLDTKSAQVRGTVGVPRARAVLDKIPESAEAPSPDTVVYRADSVQDEKGFGYDVDIEIKLGDDVRLDGFGLSTALTGQLQLNGTDSSPFRGNGELRLVDGRFESYGQSLSIERGRLGFTGALDNPLLDLRAVRRIDDVTVGITMAGTANRPSSSLFSNPSMSEASALSYLVTGRPLEQSTADESGQLADAAIGLGLSQASGVIEEITRAVGLDELTYKGGSTDGQVLAGKQISKDLYLRYAFGVFDNAGSLLLRYRLNKRLAVQSESGEEQSLDVFYGGTKE